MAVEQFPSVSHISIYVLFAIKKGVILNRTNKGIFFSLSKVPSILFDSEVTLIKKVKDKQIFFFICWHYFFLFRIVDDIEPLASPDIVCKCCFHCMVMIEKHAWRLITSILIDFDHICLFACEKTFKESSLLFKKGIVIVVCA